MRYARKLNQKACLREDGLWEIPVNMFADMERIANERNQSLVIVGGYKTSIEVWICKVIKLEKEGLDDDDY